MQQLTRTEPAILTPSRSNQANLFEWDVTEQDGRRASVVACIDRSGMDLRIVAHAQAVARRLQANLLLAQVLEPGVHEGPQDPVSWGIRRHNCRERFDWISRQYSLGDPERVLLEGRAADELAAWLASKDASFLAFATHGEDRTVGGGLGSTAQRLVEIAPASLLLVPPTASDAPDYKRILVPLDGSCRAESVLPTVVSLAKTESAEVLVVHVVPQPQFTQFGPLEPEAVGLRDKIVQRNERVARAYLERVSNYLRSCGVNARALILQGDAREQLPHTVFEEDTDLIVLAAHGHSGRADMPCGSVASYLAGHSNVPLLILRNEENGSGRATSPHQEYCSVQFR